MGKLSDDVLKWTLDVNGSPARKELTEVANSTAKLERTNKSLATEMAKLEAKGKKGSAEWKKYEAQIKANNTTIATNKKRMKELRKEVGLNNLSATELRKEMKSLKSQMDRMDPNTAEWKKLNSEFSAMQGRLGQIRGGMQKTQGILGNLKNVAGGLLPAFGFGAIIAGAVKGAKALFNMYQEIAKSRREAERLTGLSGKPLVDFTAGIRATAKTFNKDFNETLVGVNSFAQTMGITVETALQKVNDGFITGADSSGEFLSILKEYGPQFKAAGLSADESIALISQQVKTGIYSDKGIDTIKEGTLRLREMTPATKAAIEGIGLSSVSMQEQLKNGTISIFDAIRMVSNRLAELPPQSAAVGTAIADIFGGPGEDAGLEYIKMLGTAEKSLETLKAGAGANAQAQEKLLEANQKLQLAWSELMGTGTGTFDAIKATAIDLAAQGIANLSKGIAGVRDWFIELYNESLPVRAGIQYMLAMWKTGFTAVKVAVQGLWEQLKLGGKLIKGILTFDLSDIKEAFREYANNMQDKVVGDAQNLANTWKNAWENTINGKLTPVKQFVEVETVVSGDATSQVEGNGNIQTKGQGGIDRDNTPLEEIKSVSDPRISAEQSFTQTVLEETKIRKQALDNEQKAAIDRAATEEQLQQQKRDAYLSTLDTIVNVFGQESAIGKAALMAKQAYAIAETIINIAKGTGESAASAPFPANIPLVLGFVGQVATLIATIKGATKHTKGYETGGFTEFSVSNDKIAGVVHSNEFVANAQAVKNPTVKPVLDVIDYAQRGGSIARLNLSAIAPGFKTGGYTSPVQNQFSLNQGQPNGMLNELIIATNKVIEENTAATRELMKWKPYVAITMFEKLRNQYYDIQRQSRL